MDISVTEEITTSRVSLSGAALPEPLTLVGDPDLPPPSKLECAVALGQHGIAVFPCQPNSKTPATPHGYKDATTCLSQIVECWTQNPDFNIAFCPEDAGLCVVDVDNYKGGFSRGTFEALQLPETCEVETASGGKHYYFSGSLPSTANKLAPGVDTRGRGGYVLAPGSTIDGKPYRIKVNRPAATLPDSITIRLNTAVEPKTRAEPLSEAEKVRGLKEAERFVSHLIASGKFAVEGQGGDPFTFQVAAHLHGLGLEPEEMVHVLADWNSKCEPPWNDEELLKKCQNGAEYGQNSLGAEILLLASEAFKDFGPLPSAEIPSNDDDAFWPYGAEQTWDELGQETEVPIQWLVPNLIEKGSAVALSGPGGVHKSRTAVQLGLLLQNEMPFFGRQTEKATFVYLSYEDRKQSVLRRSNDLAKGLGLPTRGKGIYLNLKDGDARKSKRPLHLMTIANDAVQLEPLWKGLRKRLQSIPGHKFVVLDSTYNTLKFIGPTKSDETLVREALGHLDTLCEETDSTILYLWHPSYAGQGRGDASGWSTAWNDAPRQKLSITRQTSKDGTTTAVFRLKNEKHSDGPDGHYLDFVYDDGCLKELGSLPREAGRAQAVEDAAIEAAKEGAPFIRNGSGKSLKEVNPAWPLASIEARLGEVPPLKEMRAILDRALADGRLRYLTYAEAPNRKAGYYPARASETFGDTGVSTPGAAARECGIEDRC